MRKYSIFCVALFVIMAFSIRAFLNEDLDTITPMVRSAGVVRYKSMVVFKSTTTVTIETMAGFLTLSYAI
jgi:predicted secreted protein